MFSLVPALNDSGAPLGVGCGVATALGVSAALGAGVATGVSAALGVALGTGAGGSFLLQATSIPSAKQIPTFLIVRDV
jgi:hypothetical protein